MTLPIYMSQRDDQVLQHLARRRLKKDESWRICDARTWGSDWFVLLERVTPEARQEAACAITGESLSTWMDACDLAEDQCSFCKGVGHVDLMNPGDASVSVTCCRCEGSGRPRAQNRHFVGYQVKVAQHPFISERWEWWASIVLSDGSISESQFGRFGYRNERDAFRDSKRVIAERCPSHPKPKWTRATTYIDDAARETINTYLRTTGIEPAMADGTA